MSARLRLMVVIAATLVAAVSMAAYAKSVERRVEAGRDGALLGFGSESVDVIVAIRDISVGERIVPESVRIEPWPPALLMRGAIMAGELPDQAVASSAILAGEVLSELRLGEPGAGLTMPEGLTAVTVPSEDVRAVGGAVRPGSRVDIYSARGGSASLIAHAIDVLATSATSGEGDSSVFTGGSDSKIRWVTLAVPPEAAEQIVGAADAGALYLTLPAVR